MRFWYVCSECGREFEITPELMVCPHHEQRPDRPLRGVLEVRFDDEVAEKFRQSLDIFDILPVPREFFPPIPVGNTPMWSPSNLRKRLGLPNLYLKDDTANPTGSLKDRASFLVSAFAKMHGVNDIVVASTGNAGSSMAGIGAAAGQKVTLFIPAAAPKAKLIQAFQYGAHVVRVDGNYDLAYDLSLEYSRRFGGMSRNTGYNPMTIEGKKTAAIEIFLQLGRRAPNFVFVPVGDGVIIAGVYKGFADLMRAGLIETMPTVFAVQAKGSNALCQAMEKGDFEPVSAQTVADSISVDVPRNGYHALANLKRYGGRCVEVTDDEILEAQLLLSSTTGLFAEPAASASLAGLLKVRNSIDRDGTIVLLITGNGLKDIAAAQKLVELPQKLIKSIDELE